jgi:hypothetical protein
MIKVSHAAVLPFSLSIFPKESELVSNPSRRNVANRRGGLHVYPSRHLEHVEAERAPLLYAGIATSLSIGLVDSEAALQALTAAPTSEEPAFLFLAKRHLVNVLHSLRFQNVLDEEKNGSPLEQKDGTGG